MSVWIGATKDIFGTQSTTLCAARHLNVIVVASESIHPEKTKCDLVRRDVLCVRVCVCVNFCRQRHFALKMNWYQEVEDEEEEELMFSPALLARRASESWIIAPPVEVCWGGRMGCCNPCPY